MNDPVNRTMLLVDIEKFSDRDDVEQAFLRRMLYDVVDRTMERAGIDETLRLRADQGDSVMEFIDPNVPVPQVLRSVISELPAQLKAVNRMASSAAQMRLRAVVASGFIALDERGIWVGSDLNHACGSSTPTSCGRPCASAPATSRSASRRASGPGSSATTTSASPPRSSTRSPSPARTGPCPPGSSARSPPRDRPR
ncbi:hypothetical protein NQP46_12995 [Streptomyces albus]|nr:hypothetical protein NQP46_12995 [Streptomyces albus]